MPEAVFPRTAALVAVLACAASEPLMSQDLATAPGAERPVARARRTEDAPRIDGRLDDEVWRSAEPIGPLTQVDPAEGVPASEATEVRILYDADHLYVGLRCFDSDPAGILRSRRARDAVLDPDDRVELYFDTFHDRRNFFFFQIGPGGSKGDALVTNNGQDFNKPWDGIWEGKAAVDELGWSAELALPFKTLSFRPGNDTWGFNLQRFIRRKNEVARWAGARRDISSFQISEAGDLVGLEGIHQGIGLDFTPFYVGRAELDQVGDDTSLLGQLGADLFYKVTSSLTLAVTLNTDFAETEVDERQINLTRFPLFFPERRDFFLQDAGIFEFADLEESLDLIPFFSRRVGLVDGEEVPILAGTKLTGRTDGWGVGVLDVQTDDTGELDGRNLLTARVTRDFGEQSYWGAILTNGSPSGPRQNTLVGIDANLRTSSFRGDKVLTSSAWLLGTEDEEVSGDQLAWGASLRYPNDRWNGSLEFKEIQRNFRPDLGFVPRSDIRKYDAALEFRPRIGGSVRRLELGAEAEVVTDTGDDVETVVVAVQPFGIQWESDDQLAFELSVNREVLDEDFEIHDGVTIPVDEYDFVRGGVSLETAEYRAVGALLELEVGEFFDGDLRSGSGEVFWRPNGLFNGSLAYGLDQVSLPGGDFDTRLAGARFDFAFTPDLSWSNFVQWDSESELVGVNSRLRWIPVPGQEIFLVFDQNLERDGSSLASVLQEVAFKIVYTIRL